MNVDGLERAECGTLWLFSASGTGRARCRSARRQEAQLNAGFEHGA